jgi:O-antigen/teichoic acid export membrane protein
MAARVLRRRAVTAAALYGGTGAGLLATLVAIRSLGPERFGVFTLAISVAAFLQLLLDTTIEEAVVKYGFRYVATEQWGRLRHLFRVGLVVKWAGGAVATVVILILTPFAGSVFGVEGATSAFVAAAFIPLAQAPEGIAGAAMLVGSRYDLRAIFGALGLLLRLVGVIVGVQYGVTGAVVGILIAQILGSTASGLAGRIVMRQHPRAGVEPLADDRGEIARFVVQSGIGTSLVSMRNTVAPLALGVVSTPTQVGYFRAAQAPITGLDALSAPVRLVMLTEQTRDVEHGMVAEAYRSVRRYMLGASIVALALAPVAWILMPWLVRVILGAEYVPATDAARILLLAACIKLVLGWTKSFPVSIGRPGLRIVAHSVEIVVFVPLVLVLGARWNSTGAAVAMLAATLAFAAAWAVLLFRLRRDRLLARLGDERATG